MIDGNGQMTKQATVEIMRKCITSGTHCALLPVHVDRRGPVSVTASGGQVVTHRVRGVGDDLPEGELHVLVAGQGEVDAGILQPEINEGDFRGNPHPEPFSLPGSARGAGN